MTSRTIPYIEWTVLDPVKETISEIDQLFMKLQVKQWLTTHQQRPVTVEHISTGIRVYFNDPLTFTLFVMTWTTAYASSYKLTVYGDLNTDVG